MATRFLARSLLTTKPPLSSAFSHSFSSAALPTSSFIFRLRPLVTAVSAPYLRRLLQAIPGRAFSTRQTSTSLNDPNPNWSNRPPKETILLDGCDFEHWLVVVEKPEGDATRDDIIDGYIKTLAMVVGSEEEARMKIYSVSTRHYFAFGALVSEELSYKLKELPNVRWVLPDSYLDVKNKDYGGEPFINGQAVPYDPKYHEEWVRNNARANERNRRNDRPRNFDRSRNFERRRDMQGGGPPGGPGGNYGGGPPGGPGGNYGGGPPGGPGGNYGGGPPGGPGGNYGGGPPGGPGGNYGGGPPGGPGGNYGGGPPGGPGGNYGGGPPGGPGGNFGGGQQMGPGPNMGGQPNFGGGAPPNHPGNYQGNSMRPPVSNPPNFQQGPGPNNGVPPYQSGPGPNQSGFPNGPGQAQNSYQSQNNQGGENRGFGPGPNIPSNY